MTTTTETAIPAASDQRLSANLEALARRSPDAAARIRDAGPCQDLELRLAPDGGLTATLDGKALASLRRPEEEAKRLAETFDPHQCATALILGFGVGHHVRALAQRVNRQGLIVVYEPDVTLLRAVFERVDHSAWIRRTNLVLLTDPEDMGVMSNALYPLSGALAMGVSVIPHPPSRARLGEGAKKFTASFTKALAAIRTNVVTTMVQSDITYRNAILNGRRYVESPGVADLEGLCAGSPAITVSAGPSLRRNLHLLKDPDVRARCVIIAAQTVLKPLLREGIRPHFVTALDFHEISRRFYEGLTAEDVEGVTLVVEAHANPAILDAYPGRIRSPKELTLEMLFGPDLAGDHGEMKGGSTVAHLSYFLARHLGCDPVIMIGQDLGFTDGQYYAKGAAIHDVWAGELNEFNTLEMMEWTRIVRNRKMLHPGTDHLGRRMYTDEQMATYLSAFERAFHQDAERGLTTIDATEGGLRKAATRIMPLREALDAYALAGAPRLPDLSPPADRHQGAPMSRVDDHVREVRRQVGRIITLSRDTERLLDEMIERGDDQEHVSRLVRKAHRLRDQVHELKPAHALIQRLNQTGMFKRIRTDRDIALADNLPPREKQKRRIERDKENVRWIGDAGEELAKILDEALDHWRRGVESGAPDAEGQPAAATVDVEVREAPVGQVAAVIPIDFDVSSLGAPRDLEAPIAGRSPLAWTLARLRRSRLIDTAILLTDDPDRARALAGPPHDDLAVETVRTDEPPLREHTRGVRGARLWSPACWRGGVGGLTCYDEIFAPSLTAQALERTGHAGALLIGADWALVDPALCDAVAARFLEREDDHRVTFTQAPPGLAGCVVERKLAGDLAASRAGAFATIGRLLSYIPTRPSADPIAFRVCAPVSPLVRDTLERFIADEPSRAERIERVIHALGADAETASAERIADAAREIQVDEPAPQRLTLELTTRRATDGVRREWLTGGVEPDRPDLDLALAERLFADVAERRRDAVVTLAGAGDPLLHPHWERIVQAARDAGLAGVHVRTDLLIDDPTRRRLLEIAPDVVSVDVLANTARSYQALTGVDGFRTVLENIDWLAKHRDAHAGLHTPWLVPRLTRCDEIYEEIEVFFDKWLLALGAAVIDPLPCEVPGARIEPLGSPLVTAERDARTTLVVRSDGTVQAPAGNPAGAATVGSIAAQPFDDLWNSARAAPALLPEA